LDFDFHVEKWDSVDGRFAGLSEILKPVTLRAGAEMVNV
jgi:hypothetical protein